MNTIICSYCGRLKAFHRSFWQSCGQWISGARSGFYDAGLGSALGVFKNVENEDVSKDDENCVCTYEIQEDQEQLGFFHSECGGMIRMNAIGLHNALPTSTK